MGAKKAFGRGKYGTIRNNITFLVLVVSIPLLPTILSTIVGWFVDYPSIVEDAVSGFVTATTVTLVVLEVYYLLFWPWFAANSVWKVVSETEVQRPVNWIQPWCFGVEEGRAKVRVDQSTAIVDAVMRIADMDFCGDLHDNQFFKKKRWVERFAVEKNDGAPSREIPTYTVWHRYFQQRSGGLQFGGLYPWRQLYTYELNIVKAAVETETGLIRIVVRPNSVTDHVRVRDFDWAVVVGLYTKDRFFVKLIFTFLLRSVNVERTFFSKDRWEMYFAQEIASKAVELGKRIKVFDLLGGSDHADLTHDFLAKGVGELSSKFEEEIGIKITASQMPGYLAIGKTEEEMETITAVPVAEQKRQVRILEGEAEAEAESKIVRKRASAAKQYGEFGRQVSLHQALETAAEKGGTIFASLGTGGADDDVSKAILNELRKK